MSSDALIIEQSCWGMVRVLTNVQWLWFWLQNASWRWRYSREESVALLSKSPNVDCKHQCAVTQCQQDGFRYSCKAQSRSTGVCALQLNLAHKTSGAGLKEH